MLDREDMDVKDRADRALRAGRAAEALPLYSSLLRKVGVIEDGVYESWLEGAAACYQALGRRREAGYALMALRRFAEAERCFEPDEAPHEWGLCALNQGRPREAARALGRAGLTTLAAMALESGGDFAAARGLWERVLGEERLRGLAYETALVHFNLGQCLRRAGDAEGARRALGEAQSRIEQLADELESEGDRERALDCYGILLRLGRDAGVFENVAEGTLNSIRLLAAADYQFALVLQYYEDFLDFAASRAEWHAAATLAREAADLCLKAGLAYDRHYRQRAVSLWNEAARQNAAAGGPPEISENALVAAVEIAASIGDLPIVGRLYASLAVLPLAPARRARYAALARRYQGEGDSPPAVAGLPEYLRHGDAYPDVWRQDLVEWELGGRPLAVLVQLVADRIDYKPSARSALRALLVGSEPGFSLEDPAAASELAAALGRVRAYAVLRPLELLAGHAAARVRAAVMGAAAQVPHRRSFGVVRRGLTDPEEAVRAEALRAVRALHFRGALQPLARVLREAPDDHTRAAAVDAIADIGTLEAGLFLLELLRQETGPLFDLCVRRLRRFPAGELRPALEHTAAVESGHVREALRRLLLDV